MSKGPSKVKVEQAETSEACDNTTQRLEGSADSVSGSVARTASEANATGKETSVKKETAGDGSIANGAVDQGVKGGQRQEPGVLVAAKSISVATEERKSSKVDGNADSRSATSKDVENAAKKSRGLKGPVWIKRKRVKVCEPLPAARMEELTKFVIEILQRKGSATLALLREDDRLKDVEAVHISRILDVLLVTPMVTQQTSRHVQSDQTLMLGDGRGDPGGPVVYQWCRGHKLPISVDIASIRSTLIRESEEAIKADRRVRMMQSVVALQEEGDQRSLLTALNILMSMRRKNSDLESNSKFKDLLRP